ncbi:hypothetical protein Y032_0162g3397, partial [Ancylostoma ceylanicum]
AAREMKVIFLVAIFSLTYLANASRRDCRLECFQAAISFRNWQNEADMDRRVMEECESFAKKLEYPCSKAVPLILQDPAIRKTIEGWDVDSPSDRATEKAVKKHCWKACRKPF